MSCPGEILEAPWYMCSSKDSVHTWTCFADVPSFTTLLPQPRLMVTTLERFRVRLPNSYTFTNKRSKHHDNKDKTRVLQRVWSLIDSFRTLSSNEDGCHSTTHWTSARPWPSLDHPDVGSHGSCQYDRHIEVCFPASKISCRLG
jgi:hypothetical protein